jgi:NAD(P) transhydrogenase
VQSIERIEGRIVVRLDDGTTLEPDGILVAAGRQVDTDALGLQAGGVAVDSLGRIVVDEQFRTTADGIFAAGDVIGPTLASVSMEQGRIAVSHALGIDVQQRPARVPVIGVYSMPEIAMAGLTEQAATGQGIDYGIGRCDFMRIPRAHISGHTDGLLKLVFERTTKRLLGVHVLCDVASEIVSLGQQVISDGGTIEQFVDLTLAVPTYSLAYQIAAFDGLSRLATV